MSAKVVIVGGRADGHGKVTLETLRTADNYQVIGFIDDDVSKIGSVIRDIPVIGGTDKLRLLPPEGITGAIIGIGDGKAREQLSAKVLEAGLELINCIHPSSVIAPDAIIGQGVFVGPNAVIVTGCKIADNVIINTAATVDHDCILEDCVTLSPGVHLSGRSKIRRGAFLGTGAVVIPDVEIGEWATVGAGAVVIRDIRPFYTVVGVPAKPISKSEAIY